MKRDISKRLFLVRRTGDCPPTAVPRTGEHRGVFPQWVPSGAPETVVEDDPSQACPIALAETTAPTCGIYQDPTLKWELLATCPHLSYLHYRP